MAELQRAFLSLPPVTRSLVAATSAVTLPTLLGVLSPYAIIFHPQAIRYKLQLWRIVTPFFYAGSGISALFNFFFLFKTSRDLEDGMYKNRSHDLSWALICISGGILTLNYPLGNVVFFRALLLALTHLWAQHSPEQPMNLYGFITLPAKYLSYALLALDLVQGGPAAAMQGLTGIISSHAYWYLTEVYPRAQPNSPLTRYLSTPAWYKRLLGVSASVDSAGGSGRERNFGGGVTGLRPRPSAGAAAGAGGARASGTAPASGGGQGMAGHQWGRGNRLGT